MIPEALRTQIPRTLTEPGLGGRLKVETADFVVEEIPLYEPAGEGEHLYLWVEKEDLDSERLSQHVCRTLGIPRRDLGVAGRKDRRAITRQWISIPARLEERAAELDDDRVRVLDSRRHGNKLRIGHVRGNRFDLLLRDVDPGELPRAERMCRELRERGFANAFGAQRFGRAQSTLETGLTVLSGAKTRLRRDPAKLAVSAVQSALFNLYLARRVEDDLMHTLLPGEVVQVRGKKVRRRVEDPNEDRRRFEERDVVPAGPMFGARMVVATDVAAEREAAILAECELELEAFERIGKLAPGTRRENLVFPEDLEVAADPHGLRFRFSLPAGSYATVLLAELMGDESEEAGDPGPPAS